MIRMSSDSIGFDAEGGTVGVLWLPGRVNPSLVIHSNRSTDVLAHFRDAASARTFARVLGLRLTERGS